MPPSGKRKGDKVFGLIDYFSGQFFYKAQEGRLHSESDAAFLLDVLAQTRRHIVVIQGDSGKDDPRILISAPSPAGGRLWAIRLTVAPGRMFFVRNRLR